MSKNITKTIAATLAATLGAGVVPAMAATTTLADLHKASYDAVLVAQKDKTQKSINDARTLLAEYKVAIEKENKLGLLPQVNTFSAQLDGVQQPILSKIIKAIVAIETKKTATQAEINEIRTMVEGDQATTSDDVKLVWARTYNAKVDPFQDKLIVNAKAAVAKAEKEKTKEAVDAAKVLVDELNTSVRAGVKAIAAGEKAKADAVVVYNLKVTKAEITNSSVTVTFDALKEALRDATLEVVDNKGNKVEVEAIKTVLIEEETVATFNFTSMLKENPTGIWTINGLKVDLNEKAFVKNVKDATVPADLLKLLKDSKIITNIVDKNELAYKAADRTKLESYADVQKLIDTVNTDEAKLAEVKYVVDAASGTVTQFKNALATLNLEKVNTTWIEAYQSGMTGLTKVSEVQALVYAQNVIKIDAEISKITGLDAAKDAATIQSATDLVNKFMKNDEKIETAKADKLETLNVKSAMLRLKTSDTLTSLKAALKNLEKVVNNKTTFDYEKVVNESLMKNYFDGNVRTATDATDVKAKIVAIQDKAVSDALLNIKTAADKVIIVEGTTTEAEKAKFKLDMLATFNNLETVSAKATVKFDASKVNANLWDLYAAKFKTAVTTVADAQAAITAVNGNIVETIMKAATDSKTLMVALKDYRLGLTNVVSLNEKAYLAELATLSASKDKDALVTEMDVINSKEVILASKSIVTVKEELTKIAVKTKITTFINLEDSQKADVAELLIARIATEVTTEKPAISTVADVKTALTTAEALRTTNIAAINTANTTVTTIAALETISPEFKALSEVAKVTVAQKFNANRPTISATDKTIAPFTDFTAIRTLVANSMK
ncbi:hypothetical protein [Clostridium gasigenes]|uniref:SbsC C-terminal domain-containing protein n=1 Tax=Clostridium gasigenes TaxID=94869 RepID=A0A7X0VPP0_9CLOT|nr:hypothetical protein [Clostridium gasigenes]MBB6713507.1 hypothetical protein [Clostridium gasigenes]